MKPPEPSPLSGRTVMRIAGIDVRIHYSWLIAFILILWSLSAGYLPRALPGRTPAGYWGAGLLATLLFFASVLIHELCHSLTARRYGIRVPDITLFVFGGVSRPAEDFKDPRAELVIALAGPVASFALALLFWLARGTARELAGTMVAVTLGYLAWVNLALGVFNLIPGFPLDGGRVLRAAVWWVTGSLTRATRVASQVGKGFAIFLMLAGGVQIFGGALIAGFWSLFIGLFLMAAAEGGYHQVVTRQFLAGRKVRDVMTAGAVTVPDDLSVRDLIDRYFLHHGFKGFPVTRDGRVVGMVSLPNLKAVPPDQLASTRVGDIMHDFDDGLVVSPDTPLEAALRRIPTSGAERLLVMEGGQLVGLLTKAAIFRLIELGRVLER